MLECDVKMLHPKIIFKQKLKRETKKILKILLSLITFHTDFF